MVKIPNFQIDMYKFYSIGKWCFGIIAVMNTIVLVLNIQAHRFEYPFALVSSVFGVIFNYALFGFFSYLKSTLPPKNIVKGSLEEMEEMLR